MKYSALAMAVLAVQTAGASDWSAPGEVLHELAKCVTYRAKLAGDWLIVEAKHESPWHTYALDNKVRAEEKLAGKKALSIDRPTEVRLVEGLELTGGWLQSPPKDMSRPELRMFTWGFDGTVYFAAKAKRTAKSAKVNIRGQACTEEHCKTVDVALVIPEGTAADAGVDLKALSAVR
jgi:hypothetical protein